MEGRAGTEPKVEAVVADTGRILFGVCGCAFFRENILNKGPCEHLLAILHVSSDLRKDAPSSVYVPPGMATSPFRNPATGEFFDDEQKSKNDEDADDDDGDNQSEEDHEK